MPTSTEEVISSLDRFNLSHGKRKTQAKEAQIADSWEDEADETPSVEAEASTPIRTSSRPDRPVAPPPPSTPVSPTSHSSQDTFDAIYLNSPYNSTFTEPDDRGTSRAASGRPDVRPEKTTAVAARLIAAGIGQKPPRRTQEQRDYDRAMKLQEKKKRDDAREAEEKRRRDKEQAQKDIWGE